MFKINMVTKTKVHSNVLKLTNVQISIRNTPDDFQTISIFMTKSLYSLFNHLCWYAHVSHVTWCSQFGNNIDISSVLHRTHTMLSFSCLLISLSFWVSMIKENFNYWSNWYMLKQIFKQIGCVPGTPPPPHKAIGTTVWR